ncbi:hypothetical protein ACTNEU_06475 [Ellagibacter isourolithinifaciens]|uniref:hypothetical protein n=1 Tax=Ellagibacter isourolithinifaciens TaxID=2137581 RepID=UPI003F89DC39
MPEIARGLGVAPSTVAREIKRNGVSSSPSFLSVETRNICLRREACSKRDVCGKGCLMPCPTCRTSMCNKVCPDFLPDQCPRLAKPPFACNGCHRRYGMGCGYEYRFYDGRMAHELAQKRESSRGKASTSRPRSSRRCGRSSGRSSRRGRASRSSGPPAPASCPCP